MILEVTKTQNDFQTGFLLKYIYMIKEWIFLKNIKY